jgi:single-stranded-DNA-specific exonuclease
LVNREVAPDQVPRFLDPRLSDLTLPDAMADRAVAARRLAQAVRSKQRIVVFGDYDCDGITATAILTRALRSLGATEVVPMLANRYAGGYGVSSEAMRRILSVKPDVLVTCDCGSSDHETLAQIQAAGVDVIVIDHHLVPDRPLPAIAFLNPHRPECGFPFKWLASCGLCFSVAAALRRELNAELDVRSFLDLVAIGTIADVAPLTGDNRTLVRHGLLALQSATRPGVAALFEQAKITRDTPLTGRDVAFRIAPLINAPGRLGDPELALQLLLSDNAEEAKELAARMFEVSTRRRTLQEAMIAEADVQIAAQLAALTAVQAEADGATLTAEAGQASLAAIVVGSEGWSHGIVGIAAGRIADKHAAPTVVLSYDGDRAIGSVRGPKGARLHDMVSSLADMLTRFGGHQAALGLELRRDRVDEFRRRFASGAREFPAGNVALAEPLALASNDLPTQVLADLMRLEPCGEGNPRPALAVTGSLLHAGAVTGGHLKLSLGVGEYRLSGFAPAQGQLAGQLTGTLTIVGDLRQNTFRGVTQVEMLVDRVCVEAPV